MGREKRAKLVFLLIGYIFAGLAGRLIAITNPVGMGVAAGLILAGIWTWLTLTTV